MQGVRHPRLRWTQVQPYVGEPSFHGLPARLDAFQVRTEDHQVVGVPNEVDRGPRLPIGRRGGSFQAVQGNIHEQRRDHAPLRAPPWGGRDLAVGQDPRFQPGLDRLSERRRGVQFGEEGGMPNVLERAYNFLPPSITQSLMR